MGREEGKGVTWTGVPLPLFIPDPSVLRWWTWVGELQNNFVPSHHAIVDEKSEHFDIFVDKDEGCWTIGEGKELGEPTIGHRVSGSFSGPIHGDAIVSSV